MNRKRTKRSTRSSNLNGKLDAIRDALKSLTAEELRWLMANAAALDRLGAAPVRRPTLQPAVKRHLAKARDNDKQYGASAIVKTTRTQRTAARRLTLEILKTQGINEQVLGLAKIRGERLDPFAGRDPKATGREE